ncbi:MAG: sensor histidine kinase [Gemmatimonadetes bacterium]|jgi:two-component sensor histidine kinase|nr:sensor histidine kinase [Gemmatimonadota bacterium]
MGASILAEVFGALETGVLERREDGLFTWLSGLPSWWGRVWGEGGGDASALDLGGRFPFLENFLIDAEIFWTSPSGCRLRSGMWYEMDDAGEECHLEASAVCVAGRKILLVELLKVEEDERQRLIQKGRDNQLEFLRELAKHEKTEEFLYQVQVELEAQVAARTEKLKAANEALQEEIGERTLVEEKLRTSLEEQESLLEEKETLLQEIHHRVKNNLQVISSLIDLQARDFEEGEIHDLFLESSNRVRSMGLIHEKMYQFQQLTQVDLRSYIQALASELVEAYRIEPGRIGLQVDAEEVILNVEVGIPCGLILNELISNALKHGFPEGKTGTIRIYARMEALGQIVVGVWDDGVGLPEEVNLERASSLGLTLVRQLTRQLRGEIILERNEGTNIQIVFANPDDGSGQTQPPTRTAG